MKFTDANKIARWSDNLNGVFTMSDLKVLFGERTEAALYKKLTGFVNEGLLVKVLRGVYATPDTSLEVISNRINSDSYISTGTVLAQNTIIGSIPGRKVQAVKIGRPKVYEFKMGTIEHLSITSGLFFGFDLINGIKYANPEKAFLDVCYYYYKGKRFSFDLDSDIDRNALDSELIEQYLKKYDKRFITFFRRRWSNE